MAQLSRTRPVSCAVAASACLAIATALGVTSGCSSGSASADGGSSAEQSSSSTGGLATDGSVGCADDPRGEKFMLNMTHKGDSGMLSFVIAAANYNPPAVEDNSWTVKILDSSGQPVNNAVLSFPRNGHPSDPWMPDHSHGALPAKATNNMDGTYTITPLYFFMGGIWATFIEAQVGSVTDSTTFMFCVGS